jgi:hypothetical protein
MSIDGKSLQRRLLVEFPQCKPVLLEFPSGAFMIDLVVRDEGYVVEYLVGHGFGLSKLKTAVFGWEGYEESFDTAEALEHRIRKLVALQQ